MTRHFWELRIGERSADYGSRELRALADYQRIAPLHESGEVQLIELRATSAGIVTGTRLAAIN